MKTNTLILVALVGAVAVGGVVMFQRSKEAEAKAKAETKPISNPVPPPRSDAGIGDVSISDLLTFGKALF